MCVVVVTLLLVLIPLKSGQARNGQRGRHLHPQGVLIPLKSGQARNANVVGVYPRKGGLNPFEIRAGQKRKVIAAQGRLGVLIPLKSGQARNNKAIDLSRVLCLNPFEIRAGQKLPAPKKRSMTRTCKGLYGFFRLAKRCLFWHSCQLGSLRSVSGFFQPAILNHAGASGRRFQAVAARRQADRSSQCLCAAAHCTGKACGQTSCQGCAPLGVPTGWMDLYGKFPDNFRTIAATLLLNIFSAHSPC